MGRVYLARHETLGKRVAVKVLRSNLPTDVNAVERFIREARATASLDHPTIVDIYDAGKHEDTYYIVMQYVDGESLSARLKREGRLPLEESLRIFRTIAQGIGHAHSKGIIHRDIKPDNILLGRDGSVKLVDFGLARVVEGDSNISQTGTIVGSPTFMSPEQALGKKLDQRTDIYSLGATLYQMLTGETPFCASGTIEVVWKIVKEPPRPAHEVCPDVSLRLSRYVHELMRKDPRKRIESIPAALAGLDDASDAAPEWGPRSRWAALGVAAAVLISGLVGIFGALTSRSSAEASSPAAVESNIAASVADSRFALLARLATDDEYGVEDLAELPAPTRRALLERVRAFHRAAAAGERLREFVDTGLISSAQPLRSFGAKLARSNARVLEARWLEEGRSAVVEVALDGRTFIEPWILASGSWKFDVRAWSEAN